MDTEYTVEVGPSRCDGQCDVTLYHRGEAMFQVTHRAVRYAGVARFRAPHNRHTSATQQGNASEKQLRPHTDSSAAVNALTMTSGLMDALRVSRCANRETDYHLHTRRRTSAQRSPFSPPTATSADTRQHDEPSPPHGRRRPRHTSPPPRRRARARVRHRSLADTEAYLCVFHREELKDMYGRYTLTEPTTLCTAYVIRDGSFTELALHEVGVIHTMVPTLVGVVLHRTARAMLPALPPVSDSGGVCERAVKGAPKRGWEESREPTMRAASPSFVRVPTRANALEWEGAVYYPAEDAWWMSTPLTVRPVYVYAHPICTRTGPTGPTSFQRHLDVYDSDAVDGDDNDYSSHGEYNKYDNYDYYSASPSPDFAFSAMSPTSSGGGMMAAAMASASSPCVVRGIVLGQFPSTVANVCMTVVHTACDEIALASTTVLAAQDILLWRWLPQRLRIAALTPPSQSAEEHRNHTRMKEKKESCSSSTSSSSCCLCGVNRYENEYCYNNDTSTLRLTVSPPHPDDTSQTTLLFLHDLCGGWVHVIHTPVTPSFSPARSPSRSHACLQLLFSIRTGPHTAVTRLPCLLPHSHQPIALIHHPQLNYVTLYDPYLLLWRLLHGQTSRLDASDVWIVCPMPMENAERATVPRHTRRGGGAQEETTHSVHADVHRIQRSPCAGPSSCYTDSLVYRHGTTLCLRDVAGEEEEEEANDDGYCAMGRAWRWVHLPRLGEERHPLFHLIVSLLRCVLSPMAAHAVECALLRQRMYAASASCRVEDDNDVAAATTRMSSPASMHDDASENTAARSEKGLGDHVAAGVLAYVETMFRRSLPWLNTSHTRTTHRVPHPSDSHTQQHQHDDAEEEAIVDDNEDDEDDDGECGIAAAPTREQLYGCFVGVHEMSARAVEQLSAATRRERHRHAHDKNDRRHADRHHEEPHSTREEAPSVSSASDKHNSPHAAATHEACWDVATCGLCVVALHLLCESCKLQERLWPLLDPLTHLNRRLSQMMGFEQYMAWYDGDAAAPPTSGARTSFAQLFASPSMRARLEALLPCGPHRSAPTDTHRFWSGDPPSIMRCLTALLQQQKQQPMCGHTHTFGSVDTQPVWPVLSGLPRTHALYTANQLIALYRASFDPMRGQLLVTQSRAHYHDHDDDTCPASSLPSGREWANASVLPPARPLWYVVCAAVVRHGASMREALQSRAIYADEASANEAVCSARCRHVRGDTNTRTRRTHGAHSSAGHRAWERDAAAEELLSLAALYPFLLARAVAREGGCGEAETHRRASGSCAVWGDAMHASGVPHTQRRHSTHETMSLTHTNTSTTSDLHMSHHHHHHHHHEQEKKKEANITAPPQRAAVHVDAPVTPTRVHMGQRLCAFVGRLDCVHAAHVRHRLTDPGNDILHHTAERATLCRYHACLRAEDGVQLRPDFRLTWQDSRALEEVQSLLHTATPILLPGQGESSESVRRLLHQRARHVLSRPLARGMLTMATQHFTRRESVWVPPLRLDGRTVDGIAVVNESPEVQPERLMWPLFHNGCAAGFRFLPPLAPPHGQDATRETDDEEGNDEEDEDGGASGGVRGVSRRTPRACRHRHSDDECSDGTADEEDDDSWSSEGDSTGTGSEDSSPVITRHWIVYRTRHIPCPAARAGLLLAAGVLGHLKVLQLTDIYSLLVTPPIKYAWREATTIAVMLGLSCSFRGSNNHLIFRCLSMHIQSLTPRVEDIEVSLHVQSAALVAVGLLCERTLANPFLIEMFLVEMSRLPSDEHCTQREGYALGAGMGLGLALLGIARGGYAGLRRVEERLVQLMTGAKRPEAQAWASSHGGGFSSLWPPAAYSDDKEEEERRGEGHPMARTGAAGEWGRGGPYCSMSVEEGAVGTREDRVWQRAQTTAARMMKKGAHRTDHTSSKCSDVPVHQTHTRGVNINDNSSDPHHGAEEDHHRRHRDSDDDGNDNNTSDDNSVNPHPYAWHSQGMRGQHASPLMSCTRVYEGAYYNVSVCGPAAVMALGLMYLRSGDVAMANQLAPPDTIAGLAAVSPFMCLLRTLMSGVVRWDEGATVADRLPHGLRVLIAMAQAEVHTRDSPHSAHCSHEHSRQQQQQQPGPSSAWAAASISMAKLATRAGLATPQLHYYLMLMGHCIAGAVMAMGMCHAGSLDTRVRNAVARELRGFLAGYVGSTRVPIPALQRSTGAYAPCITACATSLSLVMAGSGDGVCAELLHRLWQCPGAAQESVAATHRRPPPPPHTHTAAATATQTQAAPTRNNPHHTPTTHTNHGTAAHTHANMAANAVPGAMDASDALDAAHMSRRACGGSAASWLSAGNAYGNQMAISTALGLLFLGGGRLTLTNSRSATAALLLALYPRWPRDAEDNVYHLQALRPLYGLAVVPRVVEAVDAVTGRWVSVPLRVTLRCPHTYVSKHRCNKPSNEGVNRACCYCCRPRVLRLRTPCLYPPVERIDRVEVCSARHYALTLINTAGRHGRSTAAVAEESLCAAGTTRVVTVSPSRVRLSSRGWRIRVLEKDDNAAASRRVGALAPHRSRHMYNTPREQRVLDWLRCLCDTGHRSIATARVILDSLRFVVLAHGTLMREYGCGGGNEMAAPLSSDFVCALTATLERRYGALLQPPQSRACATGHVLHRRVMQGCSWRASVTRDDTADEGKEEETKENDDACADSVPDWRATARWAAEGMHFYGLAECAPPLREALGRCEEAWRRAAETRVATLLRFSEELGVSYGVLERVVACCLPEWNDKLSSFMSP